MHIPGLCLCICLQFIIVIASFVLFTVLIALFQNFLTKTDKAYKHFLPDKWKTRDMHDFLIRKNLVTMVNDNTKSTKQRHILAWYDFSYISVGKGRVSADVCFPRAETFLTAFGIILLKIEETWFTTVTVFSFNMLLERYIRVLLQKS